jgi:hypothetical protein
MPNSEGWARFLFVVSLAGDRAEPRAHPPIPKRVGPEFGPLRRGVLSPKPTFRSGRRQRQEYPPRPPSQHMRCDGASAALGTVAAIAIEMVTYCFPTQAYVPRRGQAKLHDEERLSRGAPPVAARLFFSSPWPAPCKE